VKDIPNITLNIQPVPTSCIILVKVDTGNNNYISVYSFKKYISDMLTSQCHACISPY